MSTSSDLFPLIQFSAYDPVKIRSHPGVRSDLFQRPLESVLITDFLGGVAQAEVFPVINESLDTSPQQDMQDVAEDERPSTIHSAPVTPQLQHQRDWETGPTLVGNEPFDRPWYVDAKELRKWTSVFLVSSLVGWVSLAR